MIKRIVVVAAVVVGVLGSLPAAAMCEPGTISVKGGKPTVQLPRCETHP